MSVTILARKAEPRFDSLAGLGEVDDDLGDDLDGGTEEEGIDGNLDDDALGRAISLKRVK